MLQTLLNGYSIKGCEKTGLEKDVLSDGVKQRLAKGSNSRYALCLVGVN